MLGLLTQPEQLGCHVEGQQQCDDRGVNICHQPLDPEFISVISVTSGNCNRGQNVEERNQKGAWENILNRRKRGVPVTRTARSQGTYGPMQLVPTGRQLAHLAWFPEEMTVTQAWPRLRVCLPYPFQANSTQRHRLKGADVLCVLQNKEDRDVLGAAGLQWGCWACSPCIPYQSSEKPHKVFWLLCLVACGKKLFFAMISVKLCCGLMQGIRDSANLHPGNPQQYEES